MSIFNGYGFPIWRGGPMFYANKEGLTEVVNKIKSYAQLDKNFWKPAALLEKLASESSIFGEAPSEDAREPKLTFKKDITGV